MISPALRRSVPERLWLRRWAPARPVRLVVAAIGALLMGPAAALLAPVWLAVMP